MIPKIIHYCWLSDNPVPENLLEYEKSWHEKLSDYEFVKWDFDRFDKESSIWVTEAYDNKKYAFACDYIRLYALYNYGGIYMDMDIEVLQAFDALCDRDYMMAKERPDQIWIEAGCMGAVPHSPFIKDCLDYYKDRHFINSHGVFEDTPLPRIMSKVYKEKSYSFALDDWTTFTNKSYDTGHICPLNEKSYAIHHFAGSWKSADEQRVYKNAVWMREHIKLIGAALAFVYEKGNKSIMAFKKGGFKELIIRAKRFVAKR